MSLVKVGGFGADCADATDSGSRIEAMLMKLLNTLVDAIISS